MERFVERLTEICTPDRVITNRHALQAYESDGLLQYATVPKVVVLPDTAEEVRTVVRACFEEGIPWVVRGSGTGLSGGALSLEEGVVIALTRLRRIVEVDLPNQRVVVEPGVTNSEITRAVGPTHVRSEEHTSELQ